MRMKDKPKDITIEPSSDNGRMRSMLNQERFMGITRNDSRIRWSVVLLPWLVLVSGFAITKIWYQATKTVAYENLQDNFEYQAQEITLRIQQRMAAYEQILKAVRGLFNASEKVDRLGFHNFVDSLQLQQNYPGIQGVGFSLLLPAEEKDRHIAAIRREGFPDYTIRPDGDRTVYSSIIYLEPFADRNLRAFGYDMYSESVRRAAMEQARDSGLSSLSGKVTLVQEVGQRVQAGFLMYVPVYRNGMPHETLKDRRSNLVGWAYSPFRMDDLMTGILGTHTADFHLEIFDCDCVQSETKMYDSIVSDVSVKSAKSLYDINKLFYISGHPWTIKIHSLAPFESQVNVQRSSTILYVGLVASTLLSILVWLLVHGRTRAINLAQQMTIELRNNQERLALATKAGIVGIWDWDVLHNRLVWDDAMYRLYGIRREDFGGAYDAWTGALHPEDKVHVEAEIYAALNGEREYATEFRILWPDGSVHYLKSASHTIFDIKGNAIRMVGINHDLTDVKMAEQALVSAKELSEQANRSKGDFLANMSHEIRSPINAIMGMTELVLDSHLTEDQRIDLEIIQESSRSLLKLINDILDFAKIEARKLNLECVYFDLRVQLEDACSSMAIVAHKKGLEMYLDIAHDVPEILVGDPHRLKQIIINLVNNAIKFTSAGEVVVYVGRVSDSEDGDGNVRLQFSVTDTGIGIPAERIDAIFIRFTQVDGSITRKYGGTGLGLAICQQLVVLMGGDMDVVSEVGRGSVFRFTARFGVGERGNSEAGSAREERSYRPENTHLSDVHVLLGDQNETGRTIVKGLLARFGATVESVSSTASLVEAWHRSVNANRPFDVIVLDFGLAVEEVYAIGKMSHSTESMDKIILLLPTSMKRDKLAINKFSHSCQSLGKPVRLNLLLKSIDRILGRATGVDESTRASASHRVRRHVIPLRILLVEDLVNNQRLATKILEQVGHVVTLANNGLECLEQMQKSSFDLLLMDIQMPEMDGFETTRRIRIGSDCGEHDSQVPIVAVTAWAMKGEEEQCIAIGMNGYLRKPYRAEELLGIVETFAENCARVREQYELLKEPPAIKSEEEMERLNKMGKILIDEGQEHLQSLQNALDKCRVEQVLKEVGWINVTAVGAGANRVKTRAVRLRGAAEMKDWDYAQKIYKDLEQEFQKTVQDLSGNKNNT